MKSLLVLGSTGSIGTQTLDVVRANPGAFRVEGLAALGSWQRLLEQTRELLPRCVALTDRSAAAELATQLPSGVALISGPDALEQIAAEASYDIAVHGVVGAAGLPPSVRVLERGRTLALANKESLVMAGASLMELERRHGGRILPVDSELCAIFQCLRGERLDRVRKVHLTASGGPFRDSRPSELDLVTPAMALKHPNWSMGPRITVGSATLMNKALEVIEVHHLFGLRAEQIHVVIHRQSIVHSLVEFVDGSVLAQMGPPDMRSPLHFCLFHPERAASNFVGFDTQAFRQLTFEEVDPARFPALELGFRCLEEGGDSGAALNAADEVSVEAFLNARISLPDIARVNSRVLDQRPRLGGDSGLALTPAALVATDGIARRLAWAEIESVAAPLGA